MKTSKEDLRHLGADNDVVDAFMRHTGCTDERVEVSSLIGVLSVDDLVAIAAIKGCTAQVVKFASSCARAVEHLMVDPRAGVMMAAVDAWLADPSPANAAAVADSCAGQKRYGYGQNAADYAAVYTALAVATSDGMRAIHAVFALDSAVAADPDLDVTPYLTELLAGEEE